ncbi:AbrB/MazE/SpoVT family DNA-binding domain-containing protein [Candidatus Pacearchaeota archaeon]|nr:AbrB/MazE/SpoVT family DNA-binding domain-containing protein [Candidatus Pacearchaeota archaeon]
MEQIKAKAKKWGNSIGIVIPANIVDKQSIKDGTEIIITITSDKKTKVKDVFGILKEKLKRNTQELIDEVDEDLWPENE